MCYSSSFELLIYILDNDIIKLWIIGVGPATIRTFNTTYQLIFKFLSFKDKTLKEYCDNFYI